MNKFLNPVHIEFGVGSMAFLPRYINGRRALLLTSEGFITRGTIKELQQNNNFVDIFSDITPNPTLQQVEEARKKLDYANFDVIIALGGGSVIDFAKAIAIHHPAYTIKKLIIEGIPIEAQIKPVIAIPTTAGTGSEVTMWGTIWDTENKVKYSISDQRLYCETAILDANLTVTLPLELTIQTGLDALSHALESLWNKNSNPISTQYASKACQLILENLTKVIRDPQNLFLREKLLLASYYAGIAFSNTQTALAHAMSYYMTLHKKIPHGVAASFTLPYLIKEGMKQPEIALRLTNALGKTPEKAVTELFDEVDITSLLAPYTFTINDWHAIQASVSTTTRGQNSLIQVDGVVNLLKNVIISEM